MKTSKKITAIILCLAMIAGTLSVCASSVGYNEGRDALRSKFQSGEGPEVLGVDIDYSYFCPESENPCPLIVYMNGAGNGTYKGKELEGTDICFWTSDEFQAKAVNADGMYVMILRSPDPIYFDTCPLRPMFEAIRDFVDHHNVDKKRIFVFGRCLGASGAERLITNYPDYFAGACLMCPRTLISSSEAYMLRNKKIWIFCSYLDTYSFYPFFTLPSWFNLKFNTADSKNIMLTNSILAPRADLLFNHMIYPLLEKNFKEYDPNDYLGLKTVDGSGKRVASPDPITFFTSGDFTPPSPAPVDNPVNPDIPDTPDSPDSPETPVTPNNSDVPGGENTDTPPVVTDLPNKED